MARVCILTLEPIGLGGVPTMARAVYQQQRATGHRPLLVYSHAESVPSGSRQDLIEYFARNWRPRRERRSGMDGLALPLWPVPQWLGYYAPLVAARSALTTSQIHVVVTGSAHTGLPFVALRRPFVAWIATVYEDELCARAAAGDQWAAGLLRSRQWPRLQVQERLVIERASLVMALSPNTARRLAEIAPGAAGKIRVLLCPIDTDAFRPADGAATNPIGAPFLLFTARIRDPRKNTPMLMRAFARVRALHPDMKLVIIGDQPLDWHLAARDKHGLGDAVIFMPPLPHADLVQYYQSAKLFILPSLQEGLGISMLEALACGLPVIATRCGGPEGVIQDGITGRLVLNNDAGALADAILATLAAPATLAAMRAQAREFALTTFARPLVEAQLRAAFAEVYPRYF